ncbi:hypothetical protein ACFQ3Z_21770 [Streptomyces nogalater]
MRGSSVRHADEPEAGATQVIPRVQTGYADTGTELDQTVETPVVGHQRTAPDAAGAPSADAHAHGHRRLRPPSHPGDDAEPYETYPEDADYDEDDEDDDGGAPPGARATIRPGTPTTRAAG